MHEHSCLAFVARRWPSEETQTTPSWLGNWTYIQIRRRNPFIQALVKGFNCSYVHWCNPVFFRNTEDLLKSHLGLLERSKLGLTCLQKTVWSWKTEIRRFWIGFQSENLNLELNLYFHLSGVWRDLTRSANLNGSTHFHFSCQIAYLASLGLSTFKDPVASRQNSGRFQSKDLGRSTLSYLTSNLDHILPKIISTTWHGRQ